jgi:hypothetical protein
MTEKAPPVAAPPSLPETQHGVISPVARWVCPRCGSHDLGAAYLIDYSNKFDYVYLAPRRLKFRKLRTMWRPFKHLTKVDADVCRNCGMVILEVNTEDFKESEDRFGRS